MSNLCPEDWRLMSKVWRLNYLSAQYSVDFYLLMEDEELMEKLGSIEDTQAHMEENY